MARVGCQMGQRPGRTAGGWPRRLLAALAYPHAMLLTSPGAQPAAIGSYMYVERTSNRVKGAMPYERFARAGAVLLAVLQAHCSTQRSTWPLDPLLSAGYAHRRRSTLPQPATPLSYHIPELDISSRGRRVTAGDAPLPQRRRWCAALPTAAELALVLVCAQCLHAASHTVCTVAISASRWIRPPPPTPRDAPPAPSCWKWVVATGVATGTSTLQPCLGLFVGLVAPWCIHRRSSVRDEPIALSTQLAVREGLFCSL